MSNGQADFTFVHYAVIAYYSQTELTLNTPAGPVALAPFAVKGTIEKLCLCDIASSTVSMLNIKYPIKALPFRKLSPALSSMCYT